MEAVTNELYVIFHGLWVFETRKTEIRAHTPKEHQHVIAAGYLVSASDYRLETLPPDELALIGVKAGAKNVFSPKRNVILHDHEFERDCNLRHCVICLPLPKEIRSLRLVDVPHEPHHVFAGKDGERLSPTRVPMVEVFVYDIDGCPDIKPPGKVPVKPSSGGQPFKMHVFAEPPPPPDKNTHDHDSEFHGRNAYTRMAQMFKLDIIPVAPLFVDASDPEGSELEQADMEGLREFGRPRAHSGAELRGRVADSGSNCDPLIIDNVDIDE